MARDLDFNEEIDSMVDDQEYQPLYKVVGSNKIAVSKKEGVLWKSRIDLVSKLNDRLYEEWEMNRRVFLGDFKADSNDTHKQLRVNEKDYDYENLLWSNVTSLSRETIMKLPKIEVTALDKASEQFVDPIEEALNKCLGEVGNNGMNLKEKLIKLDIGAQLTNRGVWRLDYNEPLDTDIIQEEIREKESELAEAEDIEKIRKIEGELSALNEKLEASGSSGIQVVLVDAKNLFVDPNSQLESGLDADWIIEKRIEFRSTIEAKYGTKEGTVYAGDKSDIGSDAQKVDENNNYVLGEETGWSPDDKRLETVVCYYIWDKLKKRVYLYEEGKWEYPLWVWQDPLQLRRFFPYFILSYNYAAMEAQALPECSYYLPLQNQINDINSKVKVARDRAFGVTLVDARSDISNTDKQNYTNGKTGFIDIKIPEGKRLEDVMRGVPTSGMENPQLIDKNGLYAMIQKMSSSNPAMRGEEYRTNTTNLAIQQYSVAQKNIIGVRIDKITSLYVEFAKEVLRIMLSTFSVNEWQQLLPNGKADIIIANAVTWDMLNLKFTSDDTLEPTSTAKKQEAMQLAQVLGQFASATPVTAIVVLELLSKAFNDIVMTDDDWAMLRNSLTQQQQPQQQPQMQGNIPVEQPTQQDIVNQAINMEG